MNLDIRIPTGLLFAIIGVILVVYGLTPYSQLSMNTNINLWWGGILLVFGMAMLGLAWRASRAEKKP